MPKKQQGYTFIEISIVIIIIGVILGGVILARDMIRHAQIRTAVDESQFYIQALNNFKTKYGQLPGDFSTATSIWGASDATPATCITVTTSPATTCNGNGDGWITDQATSGTHYEQFHAWQQLYLAQMMAYALTPVAGSGGTQHRIVGYNIPPSKLETAGWGLVGLKVSVISPEDLLDYTINDIPAKHVLILGGQSYSGSYSLSHQEPVLTAQEGKELDNKIDDGYATTGKLVTIINPAGTTACATGSFDYNLTAEGPVCTMVFKTGL